MHHRFTSGGRQQLALPAEGPRDQQGLICVCVGGEAHGTSCLFLKKFNQVSQAGNFPGGGFSLGALGDRKRKGSFAGFFKTLPRRVRSSQFLQGRDPPWVDELQGGGEAQGGLRRWRPPVPPRETLARGLARVGTEAWLRPKSTGPGPALPPPGSPSAGWAFILFSKKKYKATFFFMRRSSQLIC